MLTQIPILALAFLAGVMLAALNVMAIHRTASCFLERRAADPVVGLLRPARTAIVLVVLFLSLTNLGALFLSVQLAGFVVGQAALVWMILRKSEANECI